MKLKSQDHGKLKIKDVKEIEFSYFKFNFSFINNSYSFESIEDQHKVEFLKRMQFLSSEPIKQIGMMRKNIGYELLEKSDFKKDVVIPSKFYEANHRRKKASDKFMIIRLYPNNNPLPIRIIGMFCSPVFYIMYIDRAHEFLN